MRAFATSQIVKSAVLDTDSQRDIRSFSGRALGITVLQLLVSGVLTQNIVKGGLLTVDLTKIPGIIPALVPCQQ